MFQSFQAEGSGNNLRWAVVFALLIDLPFLLVILFSGGEPEPVLLLVMIVPLAVSGLIIYSSYAAGRMEYVLGEDELRVSFPLSPLRVSYSKIRCARRVETSLHFRLFGGSLPGAHWGTFTTSNLGNAQVYATRYKGEFVLLELSDGGKVLITPQEPDAFLEALREKTTFSAPTLTEVEEPRLDRRLAYSQVAVVAIAWLTLAAYVASIYPGLPENHTCSLRPQWHPEQVREQGRDTHPRSRFGSLPHAQRRLRHQVREVQQGTRRLPQRRLPASRRSLRPGGQPDPTGDIKKRERGDPDPNLNNASRGERSENNAPILRHRVHS